MDAASKEALVDTSPIECAICFETFGTTTTSRAPKTLMCHHCLCLSCLKKMVCHNAVISFIICPFCRTLTVLPEQGVQALKTDEETLRTLSKGAHLQQGEVEAVSTSMQGAERHLTWSTSSSTFSLDIDSNFSTRSSIFTLSDRVSPYGSGIHRTPALWGGRYLQELQRPYVVEIPQRRVLTDSRPSTSSSVENLRVCFALGLIVSIVAVFFILVFLK